MSEETFGSRASGWEGVSGRGEGEEVRWEEGAGSAGPRPARELGIVWLLILGQKELKSWKLGAVYRDLPCDLLRAWTYRPVRRAC